LGLFILWQAIFLFGYNLLDPADTFRRWLAERRPKYEEAQRNGQPLERDLVKYEQAIHLPLVGEYLEEWARERPEESRLGRVLRVPSDVVTWWVRRTGQEQGWGLFAPNTWTLTCFVSVELRWNDDLAPLTQTSSNLAPLALTGTAALRIRDRFNGLPAPIRLPSLNQPKDIHRFVRFGHFRTRRTESPLETYFTRQDKPREECLAEWDEKASDKVRDKGRYMIVFLRYKLRTFREEHPDWPEVRQVILRSRTWRIPGPQARPWDWIEEADEPVARWRPLRHPRGTKDDLEVYIHTEGRFENKAPLRWAPKMPGSSD